MAENNESSVFTDILEVKADLGVFSDSLTEHLSDRRL